MADKIEIEILEDGTISVATDKVSGKNHHSADQFLDAIKKIAGGECETTKNKKSYVHTHGGTHIKHSH